MIKSRAVGLVSTLMSEAVAGVRKILLGGALDNEPCRWKQRRRADQTERGYPASTTVTAKHSASVCRSALIPKGGVSVTSG